MQAARAPHYLRFSSFFLHSIKRLPKAIKQTIDNRLQMTDFLEKEKMAFGRDKNAVLQDGRPQKIDDSKTKKWLPLAPFIRQEWKVTEDKSIWGVIPNPPNKKSLGARPMLPYKRGLLEPFLMVGSLATMWPIFGALSWIYMPVSSISPRPTLVPRAGIEPARPEQGQGILSPRCLPFHHRGTGQSVPKNSMATITMAAGAGVFG